MKIQHKERPILFSGPMVRAIREGRNTQTRRIIKPQPAFEFHGVPFLKVHGIGEKPNAIKCPYGQPGDRLWVRETWGLMCYHDPTDWMRESIVGIPESELRERYLVEHAANWNLPSESAYWRPSIHMPRWASRIMLEIVSVRAERLRDISKEDAKAKGVIESYRPSIDPMGLANNYTVEFFKLWESINGPGSWDLNPWVWVVEFKEVKA